MAWYPQDSVQQAAWQVDNSAPASFPVTARQSPCDTQNYAYSRASYTNYGYTTAARTPMSFPAPHPDAHTRDTAFHDWAAQRVAHANRVALWAEQCEAGLAHQFGTQDRHREDQAFRARPSPIATYVPTPMPTPEGARSPAHAAIHTEEEAARQTIFAAAPPPRPARSAARSHPPPIPPPTTRPQASTRTSAARLEDRAARVTPLAATWPQAASTIPRSPPPPARSTARTPTDSTRLGTTSDEPPRTARASSIGNAGRTAPTNDRRVLLPTPTTATPSTHPAPRAAASPFSQVLPPQPRRLIGPRHQSQCPDFRATAESNDAPRDVARPRAIEEHGQEGGEKRERNRAPGGEDALARSVRGTLNPQSRTTDHDFSRDRGPSRAAMSFKRTSSTSTAITGGVGRGHVPQVAAETPAPTSPRRVGCETTKATVGRAGRGETIATSPSTYPSYPDAGGAHSLGHANSTAPRAMARADEGTITTVPPLSARSTARSKVSLPREDARVDALPRTTSAQATSAGDPGRTSPANDRHVVFSTPTANAPSTRLAVPIATAPLSRALPPPPSRLIAPRNPFYRVDNRVAAEEDVVPHDVVRPRIIEGRGQEGEEEGGRTRTPGGAGALARSVRGTHPSVSHTADRDFSCDFAPSRVTGALPRAVTTAADVTERSKSRRAPSALYQGTDRTEQDRVISTPNTLDGSASGTTRKRDGHPTSTIPSHPTPFIFAMPPSRSGPPGSSSALLEHHTLTRPLHPVSVEARAPPSRPIRPTARNSGSRAAQSARVEEAVKDDGRGACSGTGPSAPIPPIGASSQRSAESAISRPRPVLSARIVSPLVDAQERGEYTSMNNIHLARAPVHPATRHEQEGREGLCHKRVGLRSAIHECSYEHPPRPSPRPLASLAWATATSDRAMPAEARILATKHPPESPRLFIPPPPSPPSHLAATGYCCSQRAAAYDHTYEQPPLRAPQAAHPASSAHSLSEHDTSETRGVLIHATKHLPAPYHAPPPRLPPSPAPGLLLQPPPPPNWPFPISIEELGWVLAAVVMARRMDQEDEQRWRDAESEDGNSFVFEQDEIHTCEPDPSHTLSGDSNDKHPGLSTYDGEHASDAGTNLLVESTPQSPRHDSPISYGFDFDAVSLRDWQEDKYTGDTNNSGWEGPSTPLDESGEDFGDNDESEEEYWVD